MKKPAKPQSIAADNLRARRASSAPEPITSKPTVASAAGSSGSDFSMAGMSPDEVQKLVHDLQIHQIELKIQNEELLASQTDLTQSLDRFNDLYDFAPIGYVTLDQAGTVVEANLTVATMLGVERQKLIGRKLTQFVASEGQDTLYHHQQAALDCEDRQSSDLLLRRNDGTTFFTRLETNCYLEPVSRTPHCRSAIIDITQQKLAEQQLGDVNTRLEQEVAQRTESLRKSETRLAGILDSAMDAIVSVDGEMRVVLFNDAAEKMFQCPAAAMGRPLDGFLPARFREAHSASVHRFGVSGETSRRMGSLGTVTGLRANGEEFPIEASISHIETDGQKIYTVILRDITSRMHNDAALHRQAQLLHLSHDAIFVWSTKGSIEFWNQGATRLYGYEHGESMEKPPPDHLKTSYPTPWPQIESELRENGSWEGTLRQTAKNGNRVIVSARLQVISKDEVKGMVILETNRDITDRQRLEEALLRASEEEQQRIGRDLHDGLGQEIAAIAMLNNLLQNQLKAKALPEVTLAERLAGLLKHASSMARRISHGLQPVPVDPESLMAALNILVDDINFSNGSRCVFECNEKVAVHSHDVANHLYRIAQEAVQNALRHGKPEKVIVRLTRNEELVILEIQDDGAGFDPNETVSDGIGLKTMKYRAEVMNGILYHSRPPEGGTLMRCSVSDPQPVPQNTKATQSHPPPRHALIVSR